MWIWDVQLHALGFRRQTKRYWKCDRRYCLPPHVYLSVFLDSDETDGAAELTEFHITQRVGVDNLHFYYHEVRDRLWEPGGHTSGAEIRRHGAEPDALCELADAVAAQFLTELNCQLSARDESEDEFCDFDAESG